jgi:hypothetical protein
MKKRIILYVSSFAMLIILVSAISNAAHSPGAKTGSPGDGASCTTCHTGTAIAVKGWITNNIPITGYEPGKTYTFTLVGTHQGVKKFGFEFTAEDSNNSKTGAFTITNTTETQLTNNMHAVTHTGNGLLPTNNQKYWNFKWTAPAAGTGSVTFYAALNAGDGNNSTTGDVVYVTDTTFIEDLSSSLQDTEAKSKIVVFPNPTGNVLNVKNIEMGKYQLQITDLIGRIVLEKNISLNRKVFTLDISNIPFGVYFLQLKKGDSFYVKRFIKK